MASDLSVALWLGGGQLLLGLVALRIGWWVLRGVRSDGAGAPGPATPPPRGPGGTRAVSSRRAPLQEALGERPEEAQLPRAA